MTSNTSMQDWKAASRQLMADERVRLGDPPTPEEFRAYSAGQTSAAEEERMRDLIVAYPWVAVMLAARFPDPAKPGDTDYLSDEDLRHDWQRIKRRLLLRRVRRMATRVLVTLAVLATLIVPLLYRRDEGEAARVAAAKELTRIYAAPPTAKWKIRAQAAGDNCTVLRVSVDIILDESMAERLHYGGGRYNLYRGGLDKFRADHGFRGVAYRDSVEQVFVFGDVSKEQVERATGTCGMW